MTKKRWIRLLAFVLALIMPIATASVVFAEEGDQAAYSSETNYKSPDINTLTGHGEEPEELSVNSGAEYLEKAWYEYVTYSDKAVCSYRLDDDSRLLFYDPYTYTNSMIMDVEFDATTTEFDTMSSYTISHTNSKTMDACVSSTSTSTNAIQTSGRDLTGTNTSNTGSTTTKYNHDVTDSTSGTVKETTQYDYEKKEYKLTATQDSSTTGGSAGTENVLQSVFSAVEGFAMLGGGPLGVLGAIGGLTSGLGVSAEHSSSHSTTTTDNVAWLQNQATHKTEYGDDYKTSTHYSGSDEVEYNTSSATTGWTELSARVTKTVGSSSATSKSWSESEGTTVSKTYAATHFASDGATPLPWAIVHYKVQMPMKCCLQVKYSGEWITMSTVYCLLTTVQGTCRTWMQNGQVYYEDWGSGEPVVATDFWSQFMTRDQLIDAYTNKLYPVGGED